MSQFSNKHITQAAKSRARIPMNSHVITTNDFGFIQPIFAREVVPGDKWSLHMKTFARLAPLPVPSFTNIKIINRAYYVRFRNVWSLWEDFWSELEHVNESGSQGFINNVPTFRNSDFVKMFLGDKLGTSDMSNSANTTAWAQHVTVELDVSDTPVQSGNGSHLRPSVDTSSASAIMASMDVLDWRGLDTFPNISGSTRNYQLHGSGSTTGTGDSTKYYINGWRFTPLGRKIMTILRGLGYSINWSTTDSTPMSYLPLLCYCRTFYDYILPSKYSTDTQWRPLFYELLRGNSTDLQTVFTYVQKAFYNFYENDYFTSSWLNPFNPNGDNAPAAAFLDDYSRDFSNITSSNMDAVIASFDSKSGATLFNYDNDGDPLKYVSQYSLDSLKALYNWGMRRGLAGSKYFEQIFAQFGIKLPNILTNRCEYLGSSMQSINISDVMSTSTTDTDGNVTALGDYAGKGISYSEDYRINFEADEAGFVIITSQIIPDTSYTQGRNREVLHTARTDFFQEEFDCLGMQALRNDELYADFNSHRLFTDGQSYGGRPNSIFGFTPRYSEYKVARDLLNGDFRVNHLNTGLDSFHTFRMFHAPSQGNPLANTLSFRQVNPSLNGSNFDRIFYVTDDVADHFIMEFWISGKSDRKMKSIQDSIELDGGRTISVDPDNNLSH